MLRISLPIFLIILCYITLSAQKTVPRKLVSHLTENVANSEVFQQGFTGFALFDPEERQVIYQYQADKYFTPASNTKILTFFAAQTLLRGEWPVIHYQERGDTLMLWGTGYPLLLHPDFVGYDTLSKWLQLRKENTWIIANGHYQDERYGEGWSWDDYPYGYQMEKAALPVYGNAAHFSKTGHLAPIKVIPEYFQDKLVYENTSTISRYEDRNIFTFNDRALRVEKLDRSIGFHYDLPLVAKLLQDTFKRTVLYSMDMLPRAFRRKTLTAPIPDTVFQQFMQDSDNFLAEQLLQITSAQRYGYINSSRILAYVRDTLLAKAPQPFDWVDGSGLSRYNQFTPLSVVTVLDQLLTQVNREKLLQFFPAGGVSGTIEGWYKGSDNKAFVYAKTGTLRHIHCLSGYLLAENGKTYIFSFMHNNYPGKVNSLKREMQEILSWLRINLE
ncbi:D-alanyl-D-alanine carboxypeptidase/D-alanyl-D-alanine-endopeptidase [Lewinella sp. LCG006]|uniref:D-alanyl-D-alanine carboxypeptidase/D-alanyl-D-alanine-endopeptidase n=1 Tax=Lewinella sp. LCG006 TaxID=3231911 RepID=UPI0034614026